MSKKLKTRSSVGITQSAQRFAVFKLNRQDPSLFCKTRLWKCIDTKEHRRFHSSLSFEILVVTIESLAGKIHFSSDSLL